MINKLKEIANRHIEISSPYNYQGNNIPRVTEILSAMLHEDKLMDWANNAGFRRLKYRDLLEVAAEKGTYTHLFIEKFFKNEPIDLENSMIAVKNAFGAFLNWYDTIKDTTTLLYSEKRLLCPYFGGTADIILERKINNKSYIILGDFKTSNSIHYNYFLQLSAYKFILENYENINIDGCFILQLNKLHPTYREYTLDFSIDEHKLFIDECTETFLSLVYAYYNRLNITVKFEKLFK